jgi:hypothetical protein
MRMSSHQVSRAPRLICCLNLLLSVWLLQGLSAQALEEAQQDQNVAEENEAEGENRVANPETTPHPNSGTTPNGSPPSSPGDTVAPTEQPSTATAVTCLNQYSEDLTRHGDALTTAAEIANCNDDEVLCVGLDGRVFQNDTLPTLNPNDRLIVKLIGRESCQGLFQIDASQAVSSDSLFPGSNRGNGQGEQGGNDDIRVIHQLDVQVQDNATVVSIHTQQMVGNARTGRSWQEVRRLRLPVNQGNYYLDVALLVAFTIDGQRHLSTTTIPGTEDRTITEADDWLVSGAIVLNVYLFGRPRSRIVPMQWGQGWGWAQMVGLQFGLDLDLSDITDQFYMGLVIEPIRGISLSGGLAVLKMNQLQDGYEHGFLLQPGANVPTQTGYEVRGYFGITISANILETARRIGASIRSAVQ